MTFIRSIAFNAAFYLVTLIEMILFTPLYFLMPRKKAWWVPKFWAKTNMWLLDVIGGVKSEITGQENLPGGPYIVAPKHQSAWDTFSFLPWIPDALMILKRELMWIPLFGWYVAKMWMIPIHRGKRSVALKQALRLTKERMAGGRQLMIYPEGTRRAPGDEPAYKYGIVEIYTQLDVPVVPVAHMAGLYWPRRKFLRYPGTIKARFLPPIPAGLSREEFQARLVAETEAACDAYLVEAATGGNPPPMPETAIRRLTELGVDTSGLKRR